MEPCSLAPALFQYKAACPWTSSVTGWQIMSETFYVLVLKNFSIFLL